MRVNRPLLPLIAAATLAACTAAGVPASSPESGTSASGFPTANLTIFGAASLKTALAAIRSAYEAAHPGTVLTISTDSSAAVATQIEQGAPANLFLSADMSNPQRLVDEGLASGPVVPFAGNLLTILVPKGNPGLVVSAADLARAGVKVIAAGDHVPITSYANQLVANLANEPGYPSGFVAAYAANVVSREDNVAAVVSKIALGEGDAAIVYLTDAETSDQVTAIPVPDDANVPATYGGVVITDSPNQAAAAALLAWLVGPDGQAILASLGFRTAPGPS